MQDLIEFIDKYDDNIKNYKIIDDKLIYNEHTLDLSFKDIVFLPVNINKLVVENLKLCYNNIEKLPSSLGDITVKTLHLYRNKIKEIPNTFKNFKGTVLYINNNEIEKFPSCFNSITLKWLDIFDNKKEFTDKDFVNNNIINYSLNRESEKVNINFKEGDNYVYSDLYMNKFIYKKDIGEYTIYEDYWGYKTIKHNKTNICVFNEYNNDTLRELFNKIVLKLK